MKVLVITSVDPDKLDDLLIVMVARVDGVTMASPIVRLEGAEPSRNGNPYLVYGDAVTEFTSRNKFNCSITVADCRSGDLEGWK